MTKRENFQDVEEIRRLETLLSYNILDTPYEEEFDGLVQLISLICDSPIALISMIDDKRQWYKAKIGVDRSEVPKADTFCQYTIQQDELLEIEDARKDERFKNHPQVTAEGGIRYYAGVNLEASNGDKIGTVCVVDSEPKKLSEDQKNALALIADQTMVLLETKKRNKELRTELEEILSKRIKEAEKQLLQKETEYNLLLNAIKKSNAIVEFSPEGMILSVNKRYLQITGYSREEVVGKAHELFLDEDQKQKDNELWESLREGKFQSGRLRRRHKNGTVVWLQATYNPIIDSENKITRVVKIAQDITLEEENKKALQKARDLAVDLNVQKDNFIANVSHEIRTPIHAILGFTELLLEQEKDSLKGTYLQSVKTAGDNLLYIINDILDLSKIEAGIIHLVKEPFDLLQLIKNVFSILHLKAHQKKIRFDYHLNPGVPLKLLGDKNRITQILINLAGNAIKFTARGSVELIVIPEEIADEEVVLQFKIVDTGIGIPENQLSGIFDRFSQAEADTSRKYGGTGLGLNISRQLIERQGGSITVESSEGKGSVFTFILPLKIYKGDLDQSDETPLAVSAKRNSRILLCEDNELNQRLIKAILSEKGFSIDLAENGEKGIEFLKKKNYDLILMDIQMPILDGYQTTEYIRKEMKLDTPVMALSANFILAEKERCLEIGMNDYLSKPFKKEDLLNKIDQHFSQKRPNQSGITPEVAAADRVLSLETLEELSCGDKSFQKEMISLFMTQASAMLENLENYSEEGDVESVKKAAHKLKSSFGIIGADTKILDELENIAPTDSQENGDRPIIAALKRQLEEIFLILENL